MSIASAYGMDAVGGQRSLIACLAACAPPHRAALLASLVPIGRWADLFGTDGIVVLRFANETPAGALIRASNGNISFIARMLTDDVLFPVRFADAPPADCDRAIAARGVPPRAAC